MWKKVHPQKFPETREVSPENNFPKIVKYLIKLHDKKLSSIL